MMTWSERRRWTIVGGALGVLIIFFVIPSLFILRDRPTCSNGSRDANEKGVDCGGVCSRVCSGDALTPLVRFSRPLFVSPGVWSAVASLENPNIDAGSFEASYVFKLYDTNNILVAERKGTAYIPPNKVSALFEGGIEVGNRKPTRATFEFTSPLTFVKMTEDPRLDVRNTKFVQGVDGSRVEASLYNPSLSSIGPSALTVLLFDNAGDVYAASATVGDVVESLRSYDVSFTWPSELPSPARIEILYAIPGR